MKTEMERSWTDLEPQQEKHPVQARTAFPNGTETEPNRRTANDRNSATGKSRNFPKHLPANLSIGTARAGSRETFAPAAPSPVAAGTNPAAEADCLAHDARNWLTTLRIYCDLLRGSGAVASGEEKKWMQELSSAVERGQQLVNSLLDSVEGTSTATGIRPQSAEVSSPSSTALRFRATDSVAPIPISSAPARRSSSDSADIGEAIARRLPMFQRLAGSDISVEIKIHADAGNVSLTENAFERILQNLVSNAIEAMPGGGRLRIALRAASRKPEEGLKTLLLRVTDTGHGIPPERLPYIFEAGISGKPQVTSGRPRHGLGLANVRELVGRAGGTVRVRSHVGWGSCFEVELPMA